MSTSKSEMGADVAAMVVIGAGECGTRAAFALREQGWAGEIVLIGAETGLPYERPPLSKPNEAGAVRREICDAAALDAQRITYLAGTTVDSLDREARTVRLNGGSVLPYHRLLLATGARPRALNCPGAEHALPLRTHADAQALFQRMRPAGQAVLVGAGLIGMELAATLRQAGMTVTVVEAGDRALGRGVPVPLADALLARHRAEGVAFRFQAGIERIEPDAVWLTDGTRLPADVVLAAIGVLPDTRLAAEAGLAVDNGILVDERLATADPHVFAAGDCARFRCPRTGEALRLESWQNARAQGEQAARAMLGTNDMFENTPWFWSDQYDLGLQIAGWPSVQHPLVARPVNADTTLWFQLDGEGRLQAAAGLGPGNSVGKDIKLAQMLIAQRATVPAAALQDLAVPLKSLLKR